MMLGMASVPRLDTCNVPSGFICAAIGGWKLQCRDRKETFPFRCRPAAGRSPFFEPHSSGSVLAPTDSSRGLRHDLDLIPDNAAVGGAQILNCVKCSSWIHARHRWIPLRDDAVGKIHATFTVVSFGE
jgi:hypothetical protein